MPTDYRKYFRERDLLSSIRVTSPLSDANRAKTKMFEGSFERLLKLLAEFSIRERREGSPGLLSSPPVTHQGINRLLRQFAFFLPEVSTNPVARRVRWKIKILLEVWEKALGSNFHSLTKFIEEIARHLFRRRSEAQTIRDRSKVILVVLHLLSHGLWQPYKSGLVARA